jgi:hypothetical protein
MKIIKMIITYMVGITLIFILFNSVRPYWNRYWLERHMETVAVFGTKHGLSETVELLMNKMREEGYRFYEDDFIINKDEKNSVYINLAYTDEIKVFGKTLKQLDLIAEVSARETRSSY